MMKYITFSLSSLWQDIIQLDIWIWQVGSFCGEDILQGLIGFLYDYRVEGMRIEPVFPLPLHAFLNCLLVKFCDVYRVLSSES